MGEYERELKQAEEDLAYLGKEALKHPRTSIEGIRFFGAISSKEKSIEFYRRKINEEKT